MWATASELRLHKVTLPQLQIQHHNPRQFALHLHFASSTEAILAVHSCHLHRLWEGSSHRKAELRASLAQLAWQAPHHAQSTSTLGYQPLGLDLVPGPTPAPDSDTPTSTFCWDRPGHPHDQLGTRCLIPIPLFLFHRSGKMVRLWPLGRQTCFKSQLNFFFIYIYIPHGAPVESKELMKAWGAPSPADTLQAGGTRRPPKEQLHWQLGACAPNEAALLTVRTWVT